MLWRLQQWEQMAWTKCFCLKGLWHVISNECCMHRLRAVKPMGTGRKVACTCHIMHGRSASMCCCSKSGHQAIFTDKEPLVCVQTIIHADDSLQTSVQLYGVTNVLITRLPAATTGSCHVSLCKCSQAWHHEDILPAHNLVRCTYNTFKLWAHKVVTRPSHTIENCHKHNSLLNTCTAISKKTL